MVKDISIEEYAYPLDENRIAKYPLQQRDKAKLLYYDGNQIRDKIFSDLPELLSEDTLLLFNDTKVVYARLFFKKPTGSTIEIFCLEPIAPSDFQLSFAQTQEVTWKCLIGNNKKWKDSVLSQTKEINSKNVTLTVQRLEAVNESWIVKFSWDGKISFAEVMQNFGVIPLPPYLNRESQEQDKADYQTVYAHFDGSVAAPTAGLHFSDTTFEDLKRRNIKTDFVTLHVGAGTFKPVTVEKIGNHEMHSERISVSKKVIEDLLTYNDKEIICVGTTSVRTIESLYWFGVKFLENSYLTASNDTKTSAQRIEQWYPYEKHEEISVKESLTAILQLLDSEKTDYLCGQTQLIIAPSYRYRIVKGMVTNFHQPKSTLLLLVSAMIGQYWKKVYNHALTNNYRFLSYGDACLLKPQH
ncbi:MAG: S-adenosylmethionine:tRNA ribosyltransferase-isomerase [Bacteroidales bacterium]|nr:S-adenosylmethionine:tRNA ribosyltransferase-isomerase [Bacteroidales bacterium]